MKPHILDIILAMPLLWGLYKGFRKGFVIEVTTLAALLLGIYGAIRFSDYAATVIRENLEIDDRYMPLLAFAVTFIAIVILVNMIGKLIEKLIDMVSLGFVNKLAGSAFRVLKVAFVLSVILTMLQSVDDELGIIPSDMQESSILYTPISQLAPMVIPAISDNEWTKRLKESIPDPNEASPA